MKTEIEDVRLRLYVLYPVLFLEKEESDYYVCDCFSIY